MYAYMNKEGKYLKFVETSSHTSNKVYLAEWADIHNATVFSDWEHKKGIHRAYPLKSGVFKESDVIAVCRVTVVSTRTVTIDEVKPRS